HRSEPWECSPVNKGDVRPHGEYGPATEYPRIRDCGQTDLRARSVVFVENVPPSHRGQIANCQFRKWLMAWPGMVSNFRRRIDMKTISWIGALVLACTLATHAAAQAPPKEASSRIRNAPD